MDIYRINDSTQPVESAFPCFLSGTKKEAVLLVHGYTGYPGDMRYLGEQLNREGFTVFIPRLPGHGTNGSDFLQTSWKDWLRRILDSYMELSATHEKIHVAGLSMGGLLTIILAARFQPAKIALAAPAILNNDHRIMLTPFLKLFVKKMRKEYRDEEVEQDRQYLAREYWSWDWILPGSHLYHLQKMARRALAKVTAPCLTIVSRGDTTVPLKVSDLINARISSSHKRLLVLEESKHVVVNGSEKEKVAAAVIDWFKD